MARTHITLEGVDYTLNYQSGDEPYKERLQEQFLGQEENFWQVWQQLSWHGGERLTRILDANDIRSYRYDTASGVDVSTWGKVKLQPTLTRTFTVSSANLPMVTSTDGSRVICGLAASPYIKRWNNGSWSNAAAVAGSGAVTDIINAGDALYAVRGGAVITSTDDGNNWSTVGSYTTATGVAYLNGELVVCKSDGVYNHTQSEDISTIGGTCVAAYRENLYWAKDKRLYRYTGVASYLYDELPTGYNVAALIPYRMALLILGSYKVQGGYKAAVHYLMQGAENHLYSIGDYTTDARIRAAAGGDDEFYIANPKTGGVDRYDTTHGGLSCGPAIGTSCNIPYKAVAYADGYVFVGRYDNSAGVDGVYVADVASPSTYVASGELEMPNFDFFHPQKNKVFRAIGVGHKALLQGEAIKVYYSTDEGATWTLAGSSNLTGTESAEFLVDLRSETLKLKVELFPGEGSDTTCELRSLWVEWVPVNESKWEWELELALYRPDDGEGKLEHLKEVADRQDIHDFTDPLGLEHRVVIRDITIHQRPDDEESAVVVLKLKEA